MKKSGFLRGMLDGLRSTVSQPTAAGAKEFLEANVEEALKPSHFQMETIVRHGFPYQPTAIAFDPIQRLIAIGTRNGTLRLLGRPGVDISVRHIPESAVLQIIFITNEGQMITICSDDSMHLWNLKSKKIEIIQSLRFQKERITSTYLAFQSKWLYLGTERGNTYVVNVETFSLSGYVINWNKAIELSRKTHPGCIIHLSECPIDSNKLLIGYETGSIVLWDLRNKCADFRHAYSEGIKSISWHSEGRQFICSHNDGSLSTWNVKAGAKPQSAIYPHSKSITTDHRAELCNPILKVEWRTVRNGEAYIMFSGGMPVEPRPTINSNQILTVIHGKSTTVLEMEHDIVDFITLCESPYEADYNEPYAIVVLLSKDLVVVDLQTPAYPCFQNPYPMDLHESPVTYCYYMANCPPDLVRAFFLVGHKQTKRSGFSEREWPINGGEWGSSTVSYAEIIITGHADGSLKFWDASSVNLQILYKMKTAKLFERPKAPPAHYILPGGGGVGSGQSGNNGSSSSNQATGGGDKSGENGGSNGGENEDFFAIEYICFTAENRTLCVSGACSQVMVFKFNKQECSSEIGVVEVVMNYDDPAQTASALEPEVVVSGTSSYCQTGTEQAGGHDSSLYYPLRARTGHHKRLAGFQAELVAISPWIDRRSPPYRILSMSHNMHASLLAYGTENSLIIIDLVQRSVVLNVSTLTLYGPSDPIERGGGGGGGGGKSHSSSKATKRCTSAGPYAKDDNNGSGDVVDRCRSPVTENVNGVCMSPTTSASNSGRNSAGFAVGSPGSAASSATPSTPGGPRSKAGAAGAGTAAGINSSQGSAAAAAAAAAAAELKRSRSQDKLDNFTRSRSSSMSSLESVGSEAVQFLSFANTYMTKNDSTPTPTLWVGTNFGSVIVISLTMPDNYDNRVLCLQTVLATPTPCIFRLKGPILNIGFMDSTGALLSLKADQWKDSPADIPGGSATAKRTGSLTIARSGSGGAGSKPAKISPSSSSSSDFRDSHLVVITSEKQVRLIAMPLQLCAQKANITETSQAVRADIVQMKTQDAVCLAVYVATGNIIVYSLPSLRQLVDVDFLPLTDVRIARTLTFSTNGHGMYLSSPSELTKFTISANFAENLPDMVGALYTAPKELPEPPRQSFLKGFFGGAPTPLDREELFGESNSGKALKATARLIPGSSEHAKAHTAALGGEFAKLREGFTERGERLGKLEDSTAKMQSEAEAFGSVAHAVMLKYRDKKWYQF